MVRLINSPAGYAKNPNGSKLIRYGRQDMTFSSGAEFLAFIETHKPTLGDMLECTILTPDNRRIDKILAAEVIQGPIPYHHPQPVHIPESEQWRVKENIVWCVDALTGQEWFEPT